MQSTQKQIQINPKLQGRVHQLKRLKKLEQSIDKDRNTLKKIVYKRVFKDNSVYKGDIKDKKRHGFGKHRYENGSIYIGGYQYGKRNGYGEFMDKSNGNRYWGEYKDGYRHGRGKLEIYNCYLYQGQFCKGEMNGEGKTTFADKSYYQGYFRNGQWARNGKFVDKCGKQHKLYFDRTYSQEIKKIVGDWKIYKQLKQFIDVGNTSIK